MYIEVEAHYFSRDEQGYHTVLPPLSIPNLLNPYLDDHRSSPLPPISTTESPQTERVSPQTESGRTNSTETTPSKKSEKSTKAPEVAIQKPRGPRQKKATKERKAGPTPEKQHHDRLPLCLKNNQRQDVFVEFTDVAAHTAKCDTCNNRNRDGMSRCTSCGWQCCRQCLGERGGNRSHQSFTSTHVPADERRSSPSLPHTPTPAPRHALSGSGPMSPLPTPAPATARGESEAEKFAAERAAANTLVDISFDGAPRRNGDAHLDRERAGPDSVDAAADSGIGGAGQLLPHQRSSGLRRDWMSDSQMAGEEFENPRRNPSRRARPIDLAE
ncbi:hypothetical protein N7504_002970 [Penicillium tannophilum]|nr:hypothetical protein N7504_002970 [Penicillium tannophilum]